MFHERSLKGREKKVVLVTRISELPGFYKSLSLDFHKQRAFFEDHGLS